MTSIIRQNERRSHTSKSARSLGRRTSSQPCWAVALAIASMYLMACTHGSEGVESKGPGEETTVALCAPCQNICKPPIFVDSKIFEPYHSFTLSTLPKVLRVFETAMEMDSARALQKAHEGYNGGTFGITYKVHESGILSLVNKKSAEDPASDRDIKSLKCVLTALYADTATGLRQMSKNPPSPKFLAVYKEHDALILDLISKAAAADFEMSPEHQVAVCRALSADAGAARPQALHRTAEIVDEKLVYDAINETDCLKWPSAEAKARGGKKAWGSFSPHNGDRGLVVGEAFVCGEAKEIYILKIGDYYVPVASHAVRLLEDGTG